MSTPGYKVWLDEERQIVRQQIDIQPDLPQFLEISAETGQCARQLRQPDEVRVLIEGTGLGSLPRGVRSATIETLKHPDLKRVAVVTSHRFTRIMMRFIVTVTGIQKIRAFSNREDALDWLLP